MIHDLHFNFGGINSIDKNVTNVSIGGGTFTDLLVSGKNILEEKIDGREKPYFYGVERDPLSFSINLWFNEGLDEKEIQEVMRWLDSDIYRPFYFLNHPNRLWYAMVVDDVELIHNGLLAGYLTLNIRTNHPFTLSPNVLTETFIFQSNTGGQIIEVENKGMRSTKPILHILKIGNGDFTIRNLSNDTGDFTFTELVDGEELMVDCDNKDIESSQPTYRYDNFSDNFLEFSYGINSLEVVGDLELQFEFEYKGY